MHTERTPNPASVKWVLGRELVADAAPVSFSADPGADVSPLAARVLAVSGVGGVLIGADFLTVTKIAEAGWRDVGRGVSDAIRDWDVAGETVLGPAFERARVRDDDVVVGRIRQILHDEIGPYVAQDGGEITLAGFEDGVVQLVLKGACESCPSSSITLKMGVEARLREEIPEVRAVVAVDG
jgi:Fe-S cluster biogenesis protein NfuA